MTQNRADANRAQTGSARPRSLRIRAPFLLILAFWSPQALAQSPDPDATTTPLGQYVPQVFTVDDGLPSNIVRAVAQTPDGYLWLGTLNGLARFDGVNFTVFTSRNMPGLTGNAIERLAVTDDGSLWIAPFTGGLLRYRRGYTTTFGPDDGLTAGPVTVLTKGPSGTLWIGTRDGALYRIDDNRLEPVALPVLGSPWRIASVLEQQDGTLWVANPPVAVYRYAEGRWQAFGREESFAGREVFVVGTDGHGEVWAAGRRAVFRFDGERFAPVDFVASMTDDVPDGAIVLTRMTTGPDNRPWFAGGLGIIRAGSDRIEFFGMPEGLPDRRVLDMYIDDQGAVWVGTYGGLARLRVGEFATFLTDVGLGFGRTLLQARDGTIWAGGEAGVGRFATGGFDAVVLDPDIRDREVWSLAQDAEDYIWAASTNGLVRFKGREARIYTTADGLPGDDMRLVYVDPIGDLWAAANSGGLVRMIGGEFEPVSGMEGRYVRELHRDRSGLLWIADFRSGLRRWDGERMLPFSGTDAIGELFVTQFLEDADGTMWMASIGNGLVRFRDGSVTAYTTGDGLFTDSPLGLVEDDAGTFWLSSDDGIFSVNRQDLEDFDAGLIAVIPHVFYGRLDGVSRVEAESRGFPGAIKTDDGRLWFSMAGDTVAVTDPHATVSALPPAVYFEEISAGGEVLMSTAQALPEASRTPDSVESRDVTRPTLLESTGEGSPRITIPIGTRDIEIRYTAVGWKDPEEVLFRYRLGGDHEWAEVGSLRDVHFAGLLPGQYELSVAAANPGGAWSEPASIAFTVPAYFHETLWFRSSAVLAIAAAAFGLFFRRTSTLRRHAADLRVLVTQRDQSLDELKRSQERGRHLAAQSLEETLLHRAAEMAAETDSFEEALQQVVDMLCEMTGWPVGHVYEISPSHANLLVPTTIWHLKKPDAYSVFQEVTERTQFLVGEGLPGRILESGEPVWITDVQIDPNFPRNKLARDLGVKGAFGFPVKISDEVVAVLEFFADQEVSPDENLMQTISNVGEQLSRVFERKRAVEELRQARQAADVANLAKSEFLSNMSHELRTPLNGVLGYAQILQRDRSVTPEQRENLDAIESCGQHLLTLINDILDLSKIEAGRLEVDEVPCDLHRLLKSVSDIVSPQAESKGLTFSLEVSPEVPRGILTDPTKLKQVLVNLAGNAVKFTDEGTVTLGARESPDSVLQFVVQDTGMGMTLEELQEIFDPFKQAEGGKKTGGTGLGLPISKRLVEALGGKLEVESQPGRGSSFIVAHPLIEVPQKDLSKLDEEPLSDQRDFMLAPGQDVTVLVADDLRENRDVLVKLLEGAGFTTVQADNGKEALEALREHDMPLVLMDVRMPVMNGIEATRAIRNDPSLRDKVIVAVSASVFPDFRKQAMEVGFDDFISKPFRASEVFTKIEHHLKVSYTASAQEIPPDSEQERVKSGDQKLPPEVAREVARRVQEAVELGDVSELTAVATELTQRTDFTSPYGEEIARLAKAFDFEGLSQLASTLVETATPSREKT